MIPAQEQIKLWRENPVQFVLDNFKVKPDPWQEKVLRAFPHKNRIAMKACKGPGKMERCFNEIETPSGIKLFGDLKSGDYVFAEDGSPTRIKNIYPQGCQDIYTLKFDDGSESKVGLEHLWKVRGRTEKRKGKWVVLNTRSIIRRGVQIKQGKINYNQFQIPCQGPAQFISLGVAIDPYVLGVWLGDGTRGRPTYSSVDFDVSDTIKSKGHKVSFREVDGKCPLFYVSGIQGELKRIGVLNKYSYEKFIPNEYLRSSINNRIELLRGLMDTDGTVDRDDSNCEYNTTSKKLSEDILWLVRSLGGKAKLRKTKKTTHRDCYRINICTPFNPFNLNRKKFLWKKVSQDRYLMRTIVSIENTSREEAMCIEVEHNSQCYLTNDFIVTHNTCLEAWLAWNFLSTRPHPKMAATSVTSDNLSDNLWPEMAKWQNASPFLIEMFQWTKTRIFAKHHPATWFLSARTWSKSADITQQADTLSGLHADYLLFILDEVGGIPDAVMATAEAGLATGIETKILMAGNPTHTEGPLYRACTSESHLWYVVEITGDPDDPDRSSRISTEWARQQIEKYGRDNPWVLVNVFGQFPPSSLNTLIGPEEVRAAMKKRYKEDIYNWAQKRLGIDVARFGDDRTVIFPRQGLASFNPVMMRHNRGDPVSVDIGTRVIIGKEKWNSELEIFDDTVGWAHGAIDHMVAAGYSPIPVAFHTKAYNPRYKNRRAEMWFEMCEWIKRGGTLPDIPELVGELCTPTYMFDGGKFQLEDKKLVKDRLGRSPDLADALALTFALPELPREEVIVTRLREAGRGTDKVKCDYDPFDDNR